MYNRPGPIWARRRGWSSWPAIAVPPGEPGRRLRRPPALRTRPRSRSLS